MISLSKKSIIRSSPVKNGRKSVPKLNLLKKVCIQYKNYLSDGLRAKYKPKAISSLVHELGTHNPMRKSLTAPSLIGKRMTKSRN